MPTSGYVIGFDFGLKHIGVALGQDITGTARGLKTLPASDGKPRWHEVDTLLQQYKPAVLVVGLPLNMDGSESDMSVQAQKFAAQLAKRSRLLVHTHDERLTSHSAKQAFEHAREMGTAATEHELAACLIVESWLAEQY